MEREQYKDISAMKGVDIRTVDPAALIDICEIEIDSAKEQPEQMLDFVRQIRNPYCFRCGSMVVKISYADTETTMEERMESFFRSL